MNRKSESDLERTLSDLLPAEQRTGDLAAELTAAVTELVRRRIQNTTDGGRVITAMRERLGWSWRDITIHTGLSPRTARYWKNKIVKSSDVEEGSTT